WELGADANSDARFDPKVTLKKNSDGSWKMTDTQVRMSVFTSSGYNPGAISTYNRDELAKKGYMQSPNDWKNVEITGFVKVNSASTTSENFAWYARGGRHTDTNSGCEGSAYKGDLYYDGKASWAKESWHVAYDYTDKPSVTKSIMGRWVGFKAVMHNVTVNGKVAVKMESYLNDNADKVTWTKVHEHVDAGDFGGGASHCGASDDMMPMTWGGPLAVYRWDGASDVDFKWLSVREIQP
ncbi:MAG: carbohydrate-binding protein, partial [Myxococcaceae bacterium]|nr:carbohydrate-binding protein [Myxococcaceae bacterium]